MLARTQSCLLPALLVASWLVLSPAVAQVNGVPPSISSMGFGGSNSLNHVAAPSVTSLVGNHGTRWAGSGACCSNFFWPASPSRSGFSGRRHRRKDHYDFPVGIVEPVYVPYAEPYAGSGDEIAQDDSASASDMDNFYAFPPKRVRNFVERPADWSESGESEEDEPVIAQPATVLVFKDGHKADVLNYAIVGNTLFNFSSERTLKILLADLDLPATQKANDDRGVDFQVPGNIVPGNRVPANVLPASVQQ